MVGLCELPDFIVACERDVYFLNQETKEDEVDLEWKAHSDKSHDDLYREHGDVIDLVKSYVESETHAEWVSEEGDEAGIIATTVEEMDEILLYTDRVISGSATLAYLRSTVYMRFTHSDFHKGSSLRRVCEKLGVSKGEVFAIGDSQNDLGMLDADYAAKIACPANAVSVVKKRVSVMNGIVASMPASEGTLEALHFYFGEESMDY